MFIHDQFNTDSCYAEELQQIAKDCYLKATDRELFQVLCHEAFGVDRPLPQEGKWNPKSIYDADYLVC